MEKEPIIQVKGIHKYYGKIHALDNIDFHIYPGEVVGLVGDNGSGKSTFVKILSGVLSPDGGKIYYNGKETRISSVKVARSLGIETVHQERKVAPDRSVYENVFLGRELTKFWGFVDMEKMKEATKKLMKTLELDVSPDQEANFCSGGERQGIAVSRALYFKAKAVILDEPTTALAIKGASKVIDFVKELKKRGIAVIYVSHNIGYVYDVADRFVIFSHKGKQVLDVPRSEMSEEELRKVLLSSSL